MGAMPDDTISATSVAMPAMTLGDGAAAFDAAVERARGERWANRLWDRDTTLWSTNERVRAAIADRLGWLDAPAHFSEQIAALEGFGEGARDAGFATAV